MSMDARLVQVSEARLKQLIADPEEIGELFSEAPPQAMDRLAAMGPAMVERLKQTRPRLDAMLAGMDPAMRDALKKRFESAGVTSESLASGAGAEALAKMMQQRLGAMRSSAAGRSNKAAALSLDKAWHGIHFLMCGNADATSSHLGQALIGGSEIGDDDFGYGPARYFSAAQVADIARELSQPNLETEMKARYDGARMNSLSIYPGGWDRAGQLDWLMDEFRKLRDFYNSAAAAKAAVITCIV